MSFSNDVKKELLSAPVRMNCCRKALLFGLLYNSRHKEGTHLCATFGMRESASLAASLLGEVAKCEISEIGVSGRRSYMLDFSSKAFASFAMRIGSGEGIADTAKFRCEECRAAFLRGVLIALVTVNDPHKSYHLEIPLAKYNRDRISALEEFFIEGGFEPKVVERDKTVAIYFKSNMQISDILSFSGAMKASFEVTNRYIERDIRNNENRATNLVTTNISKSVNAARRQVLAINKLIEANRLDMLPSELVQTAMLRLENEDVSLSELALLHEPPISKSGLNNRIKRILDEADELE